MENSACFQILGIDIFLDHKVKPWLIEVNKLASFATDSPLDQKIKYNLIYETIALLNLSNARKDKWKQERQNRMKNRQTKEPPMTLQEREEKRKLNQLERDRFDERICTGFVRVYPAKSEERQQHYDLMLDHAK